MGRKRNNKNKNVTFASGSGGMDGSFMSLQEGQTEGTTPSSPVPASSAQGETGVFATPSSPLGTPPVSSSETSPDASRVWDEFEIGFMDTQEISSVAWSTHYSLGGSSPTPLTPTPGGYRHSVLLRTNKGQSLSDVFVVTPRNINEVLIARTQASGSGAVSGGASGSQASPDGSRPLSGPALASLVHGTPTTPSSPADVGAAVTAPVAPLGPPPVLPPVPQAPEFLPHLEAERDSAAEKLAEMMRINADLAARLQSQEDEKKRLMLKSESLSQRLGEMHTRDTSKPAQKVILGAEKGPGTAPLSVSSSAATLPATGTQAVQPGGGGKTVGTAADAGQPDTTPASRAAGIPSQGTPRTIKWSDEVPEQSGAAAAPGAVPGVGIADKSAVGQPAVVPHATQDSATTAVAGGGLKTSLPASSGSGSGAVADPRDTSRGHRLFPVHILDLDDISDEDWVTHFSHGGISPSSVPPGGMVVQLRRDLRRVPAPSAPAASSLPQPPQAMQTSAAQGGSPQPAAASIPSMPPAPSVLIAGTASIGAGVSGGVSGTDGISQVSFGQQPSVGQQPSAGQHKAQSASGFGSGFGGIGAPGGGTVAVSGSGDSGLGHSGGTGGHSAGSSFPSSTGGGYPSGGPPVGSLGGGTFPASGPGTTFHGGGFSGSGYPAGFPAGGPTGGPGSFPGGSPGGTFGGPSSGTSVWPSSGGFGSPSVVATSFAAQDSVRYQHVPGHQPYLSMGDAEKKTCSKRWDSAVDWLLKDAPQHVRYFTGHPDPSSPVEGMDALLFMRTMCKVIERFRSFHPQELCYVSDEMMMRYLFIPCFRESGAHALQDSPASVWYTRLHSGYKTSLPSFWAQFVTRWMNQDLLVDYFMGEFEKLHLRAYFDPKLKVYDTPQYLLDVEQIEQFLLYLTRRTLDEDVKFRVARTHHFLGADDLWTKLWEKGATTWPTLVQALHGYHRQYIFQPGRSQTSPGSSASGRGRLSSGFRESSSSYGYAPRWSSDRSGSSSRGFGDDNRFHVLQDHDDHEISGFSDDALDGTCSSCLAECEPDQFCACIHATEFVDTDADDPTLEFAAMAEALVYDKTSRGDSPTFGRVDPALSQCFICGKRGHFGRDCREIGGDGESVRGSRYGTAPGFKKGDDPARRDPRYIAWVVKRRASIAKARAESQTRKPRPGTGKGKMLTHARRLKTGRATAPPPSRYQMVRQFNVILSHLDNELSAVTSRDLETYHQLMESEDSKEQE